MALTLFVGKGTEDDTQHFRVAAATAADPFSGAEETVEETGAYEIDDRVAEHIESLLDRPRVMRLMEYDDVDTHMGDAIFEDPGEEALEALLEELDPINIAVEPMILITRDEIDELFSLLFVEGMRIAMGQHLDITALPRTMPSYRQRSNNLKLYDENGQLQCDIDYTSTAEQLSAMVVSLTDPDYADERTGDIYVDESWVRDVCDIAVGDAWTSVQEEVKKLAAAG